jgi:hypothetical protein
MTVARRRTRLAESFIRFHQAFVDRFALYLLRYTSEKPVPTAAVGPGLRRECSRGAELNELNGSEH